MKFTADRKEVIDALKTASGCVIGKPILPILANVLIEADGAKAKFTCYNLEQRITATCDVQTERGGKTTIPAKKLLSLLNKMSGDEIVFDAADNFITTIYCGSATATISGLTPDDFPEAPELETKIEVIIGTPLLQTLFKDVAYAVSLDGSRKVLTGVLLEVSDGKLAVCATDGKRMALAEAPAPVETDSVTSCIIPAAAVNILRKFGGETISLSLAANYIVAKVDGVELTSKLIDGNYPNYQNIIPKETQYAIKLEADVLIDKLGVVAEMVNMDKFIACTISKDRIEFKSLSEIGSVIDSIDIDTEDTTIDKPMTLNFNPAFVADALKACDCGEFVFGFNDTLSPMKFDFGGGVVAVVMPVRKGSAKNEE